MIKNIKCNVTVMVQRTLLSQYHYIGSAKENEFVSLNLNKSFEISHKIVSDRDIYETVKTGITLATHANFVLLTINDSVLTQ